MRPARLVKIPPLGLAAESAPFDKGVTPAALAPLISRVQPCAFPQASTKAGGMPATLSSFSMFHN
jgi:hypothetical protein